jgi:gliding motility-associated-like protein
MKKYLSIFILLFVQQCLQGQVLINEYCASNSSIILSYQNKYEDFIELHNSSSTVLNMGGYYLSDDASNVTMWSFPASVNIPANGRILIYCSGNDTVTPAGQIHSNFHLTQCKGNKIILSNPSAVILDSLTLVRTQKNHSRGRSTDGAATWKVFTTPSPNATNGGGFDAYADRPVMSLAPGFYTGAQTVSLSTTQANITIRYTTNGLTPTSTSTVYTGPINVATTTVIRAKCFSTDPSITPSFTETNTYFINVTHSAPFNVISVCGNHQTLFSTGQTIDNAMEFFDTLKNFKWEFEGVSRRHGHDSWAYPQKGFKVEPLDQYGYLSEMPEKFFKNTPRDKFETILLKAAASDNFNGNTGNNTAHMRDAFCHTFSIKHNWELDERSYAPTIVYINGQYWGVYEIRERVDLDYVDFYYNQSKKKTDMVRHWGGATNIIDAGSDTGWTNLKNFCVGNNMAVPANYAHVEALLNINSLIDFFVLNNYIANSDHMNWNTMWWRGRKGTGVKWRYALWDQDNIFDLGENFTGLSSTGPDLDPCEPFTLFTNSNIIFHTQIINALLNNPTFKKAYADRYAHWLSTALSCDSLLAHLNYFENLLNPEMQAHVTRWPAGGATVTKWHANVDSVRQFILKRCSLIGSTNDSSCIPVKKIILNVDAVGMGNIKFGNTLLNNYPYTQVAAGDSLYNIEAIPNAGYVFKTWKYFKTKNIITPTLTSKIAFLDFKEADSIVAVFIVKPLDTFNIVLTADPTWAGTITIDGSTVLNASNFPYTFKAIEKTSHTILAAQDADHLWNTWIEGTVGANPIVGNVKDKQISFTAIANDRFTAKFDSLFKANKTIYFPNAFTPNADNINDVFGIDSKTNPSIVSAELQVADRFGAIVYKGNGLDGGWDGKHTGNFVEVGTYFYVYDVKFIDGKNKLYRGDVMMIR